MPYLRSHRAPDLRSHRAWRRLRAAVLAEEPLCRLCAAAGRTEAATEVDHIAPVVERPDLQMVRSNLRGLCHRCHAAVTAAQNGGAPRRRPVTLDAQGWPLGEE